MPGSVNLGNKMQMGQNLRKSSYKEDGACVPLTNPENYNMVQIRVIDWIFFSWEKINNEEISSVKKVISK